jgi:glutamyl-tRNA reductase
MNIVLIGLNHQSAPVEIRERVAFPKAKLAEATRALCDGQMLREAAIVSTCNRVELYGVSETAGSGFAALKEFLHRHHGLQQTLDAHLQERADIDSARHLFEVACGLNSMVVGETEILGQIKESYEAACHANTAGKMLHHLFQKAFQVAKHVRTHTQIGHGSISVGSVAVDLAGKIFGDLRHKTVMVLGSGEMGELTARSLKERGAETIIVTSRTPERAQQLAQKLGARSVLFESWDRDFCLVDIIISAAAAPQVILTRQRLLPLMKLRRNRPLFLIDIGVPRNIERAADTLDNVFLYDIDDLQAIASENLKAREREIELCRAIVEDKVRHFEKWLKGARLRSGADAAADALGHAHKEATDAPLG